MAGLSLRGLAAVMTGHGHRVGFAHLARVESGERSMTRNLVIAWGVATGQADPQAWARQVVEVLGQERLGRSRQVLEMEFRPSPRRRSRRSSGPGTCPADQVTGGDIRPCDRPARPGAEGRRR